MLVVWMLMPAWGWVVPSLAADPTAEDPAAYSGALIWSKGEALHDAPVETVYFRRLFSLGKKVVKAEVLGTADNSVAMYVNGRQVLESENWQEPVRAGFQGHVNGGRNVIAVKAGNGGGPAFLYLQIRVELDGGETLDLSTGKDWLWSETVTPGWERLSYQREEGWEPAAVLGTVAKEGHDKWQLLDRLKNAKAAPATVQRDWEAWRKRVREEIAGLDTPADPPGGGNPIDGFLVNWWNANKLDNPADCGDRAFVRRAHVDLVGLLPEPEGVESFVADESKDKRATLIDDLLADSTGYAEHWMTFWNDLLRNDEQTNIDGLRKPVTKWLFQSLAENKAYDEFVAELLNPEDPSAGFLKGVNWRGSINASQTPVMQAAQTSAQVFMGVNLKCASCHNHFLRDWTLRQSHQYASFFSPTDLEMHKCDKPTDRFVGPKFLFEDLGEVEETANLQARHTAVSVMVTRPKNPRFAKVIVNRLFKKLMGQGLIDRVDDLDYREAFSPELLEWMAYDFMSHDYDLKHTIRQIANSRTYQMVAADIEREHAGTEREDEPVFVGPRLRRMLSEQFIDAISCVTGYWPEESPMGVSVPNPAMRAWRHRKPTKLAEMLARPTREQVCSERLDEATILQSLELVNGEALTRYIIEGAGMLLKSELGRMPDAKGVMDALCMRAYGRKALEAEIAMGSELIGSPETEVAARQSAWEDLLWILVMQPEFQYIY
jgi:hypothetical protein